MLLGLSSEDRVHSIQTQPIHVKLLDPVKGVMNDKVADSPATWTIEVHRGTPRSLMPIREELWDIHRQIISLRPEVVVHDVQENHQPPGMRGLYKGFQVLWPTIG